MFTKLLQYREIFTVCVCVCVCALLNEHLLLLAADSNVGNFTSAMTIEYSLSLIYCSLLFWNSSTQKILHIWRSVILDTLIAKCHKFNRNAAYSSHLWSLSYDACNNLCKLVVLTLSSWSVRVGRHKLCICLWKLQLHFRYICPSIYFLCYYTI
jgi:hypothetical protein